MDSQGNFRGVSNMFRIISSSLFDISLTDNIGCNVFGNVELDNTDVIKW